MITVALSGADVELIEQLQRNEARPINWPELFISEPDDPAALDEAIESLFGYDWLILKNERAVHYFLQRFRLRHKPEELDELRIVAIGEQAAERLTAAHLHVDVTLERFDGAKVFSAIESYDGDLNSLARLNFLVPSANITSEIFERELASAGARVDTITAYRTTAQSQQLTRMKTLIAGGGIDALLFTNTTEVEALAQLFDTDDLGSMLSDVKVICANDETRLTAMHCGLSNPTIPDEWTGRGIRELLIKSP